MTLNEYDEIKADILAEEREANSGDLSHEAMMRDLREYAIEHYSDTIQECYDKLKEICNKLEEYGWEETPESLLRSV